MNIRQLYDRHKDLITKFLKYCITGGSAFLIELFLFWLLNKKAALPAVAAHVIVYTCTFWFGFLVNMKFTFKVSGGFAARLIKYLCLFFFNIGASSAVMYLLTSFTPLDPVVCKIAISAMIALWNFPLYKFVIYK